MGSARITYRQSPDATPEGEARALARAYRFVLRSGEQKKEGASPGAPDDAKESDRDRAKAGSPDLDLEALREPHDRIGDAFAREDMFALRLAVRDWVLAGRRAIAGHGSKDEGQA